MKNFLKGILFLLLCCCAFSCKEETIVFPITGFKTASNSDVRGIHFNDPNTVYVVGGDKFERGEIQVSTDGGQTWVSDTIANKRLNCIRFLPDDSQGYIVGFDSYFFNKSSSEEFWNFRGLPEFQEIHNVDFYDANTGVAVGGAAFRFGAIFTFSDRTGNLDTLIHPLENEMRDVCFIDEQTAIAVGYGLILRSTDAGLNWEPNSTDGDFFFAVHFPTRDVGYIIGLYGMVLKTTDAGITWERKRKASTLGGSTKLRDVFFSSPSQGYVVGDSGLLWITDDGADSWKVVEDTPDVDFLSVWLSNGVGMISAEEGMVFRFEE